MQKIIYIIMCLMLSCSLSYAEKKDLFYDYDIYSKKIDKVITNTKKEVYADIDKIKKIMLNKKPENIDELLNSIHSKIIQLDEYIKESYNSLKTENMKEALTYPIYELSFYEKVILDIVSYYHKNGSITKREIKEIEKQYKNEEAAVKKKAETIRNDFLKAVFK